MECLVAAIDLRARQIYDGDGSGSELADAKDLARALARLLNGESFCSAFGSPGDWGYGTPIGEALLKVYQAGVPVFSVAMPKEGVAA